MSALFDEIKQRLGAAADLAEVDAHIGALVRERSRLQRAFEEAEGHVRDLEEKLQQVLGQNFSAQSTISSLQAEVAKLQSAGNAVIEQLPGETTEPQPQE